MMHLISRHLQQRQCLQVLPRSRTLLPSRMPSQNNLPMHLQLLKISEQDYDAAHLSTPAAAPVLAGAAPKPNPPAITYAE